MKLNKLSEGHNLRWESSRMMLPEHCEQIIEFVNNRDIIKKPVLDEQKWEEINDIIKIAIEDYSPVYLDVFNKGRIKTIECCINKFDALNQELKITMYQMQERIKFENIVDVRIV